MMDTPDLSGFEIHAFHEAALPSHYAAPIQLLRTGAALSRLGARVTLHSGPLGRSVPAILEAYGAEGPDLSIVPFFAGPGLVGRTRTARHRASLGRRIARSDRRVVILTRGEPTWPAIKPLLPRAVAPLHLHEVHRLGYLRSLERRLGRRARSTELADPSSHELRSLERSLVLGADGRIFLTEAVAEDASAAFGSVGPSIIAPSGVDLFEPVTARPDLDLVYAGKIERRKGVYDLCAAMRYLPGRTLGIAGGRPDAVAALAAHVAELGVQDSVHLAGWIPPAEVPAFLRRGRVGVCPLPHDVDTVSERYSSPMKLLEMMALGLPVVATDLPTVRAVAGEGQAIFVPPNDPVALASAAARLLEDVAAQSSLGLAARERAAEFAWSRRAARIGGLILSLARCAESSGNAHRQQAPGALRCRD